MKQTFVLLGCICLVTIGLAACAEAASLDGATPTKIQPEGTIKPTSPASTDAEMGINTPQVVVAGSENKLYTVGNTVFTAYNLPVEKAALAAADFDNDGDIDLVGAGEPQITIFLNDGSGRLTASSQAPGGAQPDGFALADLDEDGDIDIAIANHDTDHLTLLLGDGEGGFHPAANSPLRVSVSPHPHVVQAEDIDLDGHLDLAVDDRDGEGVLVLRGLGGGEFETPGTLVGVGGDPYRGMALGDINGDGKPDLVTPNPRQAGVLLNASREKIAFVQSPPVAVQAPFAVALGDFNGDGALDLIAGSDEGSPLVSLFLGDGLGSFVQAADSPLRLAPGGKNIVVGDFNGDGIQDAAIASYQFSDVLLVLGGNRGISSGYLNGGEHPWGLAAADFNGDGRDDLVIADDGAKRAVVYLSVGL